MDLMRELTPIEATFRRHGFQVSEDEMAAMLEEHLGQRMLPDAAPLSAADRELLDEGGLSVGAMASETLMAQAMATEYLRLLADATSVADAARRLGRDRSRVQRMIGAGQLYAVRVDRQRYLLPAFQFDSGGFPIPHLGEVLTALPGDLDPVAVSSFFLQPDANLVIGDDQAAPRTWLLAGKDPSDVVSLAAALDWL
ncbi:MAG: helix-turn-helix domain-containing protein [Candidatus Dormibacteria bacterium]